MRARRVNLGPSMWQRRPRRRYTQLLPHRCRRNTTVVTARYTGATESRDRHSLYNVLPSSGRHANLRAIAEIYGDFCAGLSRKRMSGAKRIAHARRFRSECYGWKQRGLSHRSISPFYTGWDISACYSGIVGIKRDLNDGIMFTSNRWHRSVWVSVPFRVKIIGSKIINNLFFIHV